jgi:hypothetical protein
MNRNRFQRDPGVSNGAGETPIQDLSQVPPTLPESTELSPEQRQAILREAYDGEHLKAGYIMDEATGLPYKEGERPYGAPALAEGLNEDGTLQDGYELVEGVPTKIDEQAPAEDANSKNFFDIVETITGVTVAVDYGESDPTTPEGMAKREKAVMDHGVTMFEEYLKNSVPDAYAYLLHRQGGGTKEEFFQSNTNPSLPSLPEFESSADIQANIVKTSLTQRGVPEEVAQATVDSYIKANVLKEKALVIYKDYDNAQKEQIEAIRRNQEESDRRFNEEVKSVMSVVDETINSGSIKFIIPEAKRTEFATFVKERIRYSDGGFYITQPIAKDSANSLIESLFIQYSGNDLKKLIAKEARTVATEQFKFKVRADQEAEKKGTTPVQEKRKYIPLSEI